MKKIALLFIVLFFTAQLIFSQLTDAMKKEVYPRKYSFEKAEEFQKKGEYQKAIWFYINLFPTNKTKVVEHVKEIKALLDTADLELFIKKTFGLYGTFDPTIMYLKNGFMKIDDDKLKQKAGRSNELISQVVEGDNKISDAHYKFTYYLDQNFVFCDKSLSVYTGKVVAENGLIKVNIFNNYTNDLIMSAYFTDSTLSAFEGPFKRFYAYKKPEIEGTIKNGNKAGIWKKWDNYGHLIDSSVFDNGVQLFEATSTFYSNNILKSFILTDSVNKKYHLTLYDTSGKIIQEILLAGDSGIVKKFDNDGNIKIDTLKSGIKTEASFAGGNDEWKRYIKHNLDPMVPVDNRAKDGIYTVYVNFTINEDGSVSNIIPETHFGYGMEKEAIRLIMNSPKWIPATLNGKAVKSIKKQPITFVVTSN